MSWFDDRCERLYNSYQHVLAQFNSIHSSANIDVLVSARKSYRVYMYRAKRNYLRNQGDMLSELKRTNPKVFYKLLRKKKKELPSELKLCDFYEHFRGLVMSCENESANYNFGSECLFDETLISI